jgi:hypothetical protein
MLIMLYILITMHFYWLFLLFRMLGRKLQKGKMEDIVHRIPEEQKKKKET